MYAVVLLAIISITLGALAVTFHMQALRTQTMYDDSQLRQLLLSGADIAAARLRSGASIAAAISLPDSPDLQGAKLTLQLLDDADPQVRTVQIQASFPHRTAAQKVRFSLQNGAWSLASADLDD
jgi:hypothetical protein